MRFYIISFIFCIILFNGFVESYAYFLLRKNRKDKDRFVVPFTAYPKFTYLHAKGNNYRYCKHCYSFAKSNRVFFQVYRCWLRFKCILILAVFFSFLGAMLIIPLIALLLKYM